jgi:hypothetical protein
MGVSIGILECCQRFLFHYQCSPFLSFAGKICFIGSILRFVIAALVAVVYRVMSKPDWRLWIV